MEHITTVIRLKPCEEGTLPSQTDKLTMDAASGTVSLDKNKYLQEGDIQRLKTQGPRQKRVFTYDCCIDPSTPTSSLFSLTISPSLDLLSQGLNLSVLCYGVTGSGKSHTMFGDKYSRGIVGESAQYLLALKERVENRENRENRDKKDKKDKKETEVRILLMAGIYELYNENIRDLGCRKGISLGLVEDQKKEVQVKDLHKIEITSLESLRSFLNEAHNRRVKASTNKNEHSSRSHAIVEITVTKVTLKNGIMDDLVTSGKLMLVDLAGSERMDTYSPSKYNHVRKQEGSNINKSLLSLTNCILTLSQQASSTQDSPNKNKNPASELSVPTYRNSKLTRLLKQSLIGNSRTIMIGCITKLNSDYDNNLRTLSYISKARCISKNIHTNVYYRKDIKKLDNSREAARTREPTREKRSATNPKNFSSSLSIPTRERRKYAEIKLSQLKKKPRIKESDQRKYNSFQSTLRTVSPRVQASKEKEPWRSPFEKPKPTFCKPKKQFSQKTKLDLALSKKSDKSTKEVLLKPDTRDQSLNESPLRKTFSGEVYENLISDLYKRLCLIKGLHRERRGRKEDSLNLSYNMQMDILLKDIEGQEQQIVSGNESQFEGQIDRKVCSVLGEENTKHIWNETSHCYNSSSKYYSNNQSDILRLNQASKEGSLRASKASQVSQDSKELQTKEGNSEIASLSRQNSYSQRNSFRGGFRSFSRDSCSHPESTDCLKMKSRYQQRPDKNKEKDKSMEGEKKALKAQKAHFDDLPNGPDLGSMEYLQGYWSMQEVEKESDYGLKIPPPKEPSLKRNLTRDKKLKGGLLSLKKMKVNQIFKQESRKTTITKSKKQEGSRLNSPNTSSISSGIFDPLRNSFFNQNDKVLNLKMARQNYRNFKNEMKAVYLLKQNANPSNPREAFEIVHKIDALENTRKAGRYLLTKNQEEMMKDLTGFAKRLRPKISSHSSGLNTANISINELK